MTVYPVHDIMGVEKRRRKNNSKKYFFLFMLILLFAATLLLRIGEKLLPQGWHYVPER